MSKITDTKRDLINSVGISLVEILLTVALMSVLSATTLPLGIKFIQKNQVKNTRDTLISYLNASKSFAISGKHDNSWGVNITETKITLFNGNSFASRNTSLDQEYKIPGNVTVTPMEIIFAKESGDTSGNTINIYCQEGTSYKIVVDTQGNVTSN